MTTQLDCSLGLGLENAYGVAATPDQFLEFVSESLAWNPEIVQGEGLRVGSRVPRTARRALAKEMSGGDIELEVTTKGMGRLFHAILGASTNTQIGSGPAYQQVHTFTDGALPSFTVQKGVPLIGGGAIQPHTFHGAVVESAELSAAQGEIVKLTTTWNARETVTDTPYVPTVYPANMELFTFVHGSITIGGSVTAPTNTALAAGGTVAGNITEFTLSLSNGIDEGGFTFGSEGKRGRRPEVGLVEATGSMVAEYDNNLLRDAFLNQESLQIVLTFEAGAEIAPGVRPALQVFLSSVKLDGQLPASNGGEPVTQEIDFTSLDALIPGVKPVYVVYRSTDTGF
ncbi:phage tail tube protein [Glutamicibacter sp.]|uniref:phage tail tube protein n=1 Tax=Glutamicibacter sp. TaxID=1931995 RepID=UPI0028BDAA4C|nr:phage tail tube protein [Glutamicibacter sp.]